VLTSNEKSGTPLEAEALTEAEVSKPRTAAEIDSLMQGRGFPEMELLWKRFKRFGIEPAELEASKIERSRARHMAPLFGLPRASIFFLCLASVWAAYLLEPETAASKSFPAFCLWGLWFGGRALGLLFLMIYAVTVLQRYLLFPMERIMARDLAFMLGQRNYRLWFESTAHALRVKSMLGGLGIGDTWDNPRYRVRYAPSEGKFERILGESALLYVLGVLREFVGYKDPERRKFVPGRYTADLKDAKASVTEFVKKHKLEIDALKANALKPPEALGLLEALMSYLAPESPGAKALDERISAFRRGDFLTGSQVQAELWQRDPWVDLTHQEEFFSSASLRGVKWMGRGPKGRLGPFGYLSSKSISCLDLRSKKGRLVRGRIGAACVPRADGSKLAVLYVDGVEGSNALPPSVVKQALEDYGRECGFEFVVYNRSSHNQIPRRFVRYVAECGAVLRGMQLEYVLPERREYLDSFGLPLEPFEYACPRGSVLGHVVSLGGEPAESIGIAPTLRDHLRQWLRVNVLWLLVAGALLLAASSVAQVYPALLAPLAVFAGLGISLHLAYQRKCLRGAKGV